MGKLKEAAKPKCPECGAALVNGECPDPECPDNIETPPASESIAKRVFSEQGKTQEKPEKKPKAKGKAKEKGSDFAERMRIAREKKKGIVSDSDRMI
jgi:hypothetical protein